MVRGWWGSIANAPIFNNPTFLCKGNVFGKKSVNGIQVGDADVKSVLLQTPPPLIPRNIAGVPKPSKLGEIAIVQTRPDTPAATPKPWASSGAGPTANHE